MITDLTISLASCAGPEARIGIAWERSDGDRQQYHYWILLPDGQYLCRGNDLRSGATGPISHAQMMATLLAFLSADAEKYSRYGMARQVPPDGYLFNRHVAAWAYQVSDELQIAREELELTP